MGLARKMQEAITELEDSAAKALALMAVATVVATDSVVSAAEALGAVEAIGFLALAAKVKVVVATEALLVVFMVARYMSRLAALVEAEGSMGSESMPTS